MHHELTFTQIKKEYHGTLRSYLIGFFSSLLLTLISFYLVISKTFEKDFLVYSLIALAITQSIIQLIFFLHLGKEDKPKWESISFYFMALFLIIIVVGSLWIMYDLNNRVMDGMEM